MEPVNRTRDAALQAAQLGAIPSLLAGLSFFIYLVDWEIPSGSPLAVTEKTKSGPSRYTICAKSEPNENGGTLTFCTHYPKWFFESARLGDVMHPGFCHVRLRRNGELIAVYIPWRIFPRAFIPFALCLPVLVLLPKPRWLRSAPALIAALAIEAWLIGMVVFATAARFLA